MEKVNARFFFIGIASFTEMAQHPVTHRLFDKGSRMQCVLETEIKQECCKEVLIRQIC